MHVERTFSVPRPPEAVFDYLSDFSRTEEWDPGTKACSRRSGDGGLGTVYDNTSEFMGRETSLVYETVAFERPGRLQFRGRNDKATATDSLSFRPGSDPGSTEVHYRADFDFGRVGNLVFPLVIRRKLEALADETVEALTTTLRERA